MKKILKVLFTILFTIGSIFSIIRLTSNYSNDGLVFMILSFTIFSLHLFAWIAPRTFFNLCWKITGILPDNFDYDTSYSKLELVGLGMLVVANVLLVIVFLII